MLTGMIPSGKLVRKAILVLGLFLLSSSLTAQTAILDPVNPRLSALGGTHVTLLDGMHTILLNPAGLYDVEPGFSFLQTNIQLSGPIFPIANLFFQSTNTADMMAILTSPEATQILHNLNAGANFSGPIQFSYAGNGLGFYIDSAAGAKVRSVNALTFSAQLSGQIDVGAGVAFRIPLPEFMVSTLDLGVNVHAMLIGSADMEMTLLEFLDFALIQQKLFGRPVQITTALGADLGLRYGFDKSLYLGVLVKNVFMPAGYRTYSSIDSFMAGELPSTTGNAQIPMRVDAGIQWAPRFTALEDYISTMRLMVDYRDIFDFLAHPANTDNPLLKIGVGIELEVLTVLAVRLGYSEGLLNAGLGMNFGFMEFNAAMYGTEDGIEPGFRPLFNIALGFVFRF